MKYWYVGLELEEEEDEEEDEAAIGC